MAETTTKEILVAASNNLMLTRGYNSMTVQVSKGRFYRFFKTREGLGLAELCTSIIEGSIILGRAHASGAYLVPAPEAFRQYMGCPVH